MSIRTFGASPLFLLLITSVAVATLSGCGWLTGDRGVFRDRSDDYRRATLSKPLSVPPGLNRDAIEDQLVVPRAQAQVALEGEFEVPRPEPINPAANDERVKLQTLGDEGWILVESVPGEVWPRVRQFLSVNQLAVTRADATAGIIETGWLQPANASAKERYRFRIEQGVQRGSSEVYILQSDFSADDGAWPTRSSNPQRETEMRKALAQFIADNGSSGSVSMLAQRGIDAQGKVFLERRVGQPLELKLLLPPERAWASLESATSRAGFAPIETHRTNRTMTVRYDPPIKDEEERGFFGSIWHYLFGDDEDADVLSDHKTIYVVAMRNQAGAANNLISIDREDGKALNSSAREKLLGLIKSNLN